MRIPVVVTVTLAMAAVLSGCARQAYYYSPYPDYPPTPELHGSPPPYDYSNGNGYYGGPQGGPPPYDYSNGNDYYGGPYAYGGGYANDWPTSSSICWEPGRGQRPCNTGP